MQLTRQSIVFVNSKQLLWLIAPEYYTQKWNKVNFGMFKSADVSINFTSNFSDLTLFCA